MAQRTYYSGESEHREFLKKITMLTDNKFNIVRQ